MVEMEIIAVSLTNRDKALFVNSDAIMQLDAGDLGADPVLVGKNLAHALGVTMQTVSMDVPADDDWCWNDVYELLPPTPVKPNETSGILDIVGGLDGLLVLLLNVWTDLKDASGTLSQFSDTQEGDTPHYQESLDRLSNLRKSLEALKVAG